MAAVFTELVVDCRDPAALARWWAEVLAFEVVDDPRGYSWIAQPNTALGEPPVIAFVPVPEHKAAKNRLHLDVNPTGATFDEELARLEGLGARRADVGQGTDVPWVVLADPEGNEFCLLGRRLDD